MILSYKIISTVTPSFPSRITTTTLRAGQENAMNVVTMKINDTFKWVAIGPSSQENIFTDKLTTLLHDQTSIDHAYVDHSATHSDRVAEFSSSILSTLDKLPVITELFNNYGQHRLVLSLKIASWAHDTGYIQQHERGLKKAVHALFSAQNFYTHLKDPLLRFFVSINLSPDQSNYLTLAIQEAIFHHNGDKKECTYTHAIDLPYATVLTNNTKNTRKLDTPCYGRYADYKLPNDKQVGLPYKELEISHKTDWLEGILKISDNSDMLVDRLTRDQEHVIKELVKNNSIKEQSKTRHLETMIFPEIDLENNKQYVFYKLLKREPKQRKFFVGLYMGKEITFTYKEGLTVLIKNRQHYPITTLDENGRPIAISDFFSERMQHSMNSISISNKPVKVIAM